MEVNKEKPTWGILDYFDVVVGRFSKSDSTGPGKRRRSWSATVFFWLALPSFFLVGSVSFRVVYSTIKAPVVSSVQKSAKKGSKAGRRTKDALRKLTGGLQIPPSGYLGWPETFLAALLFLTGFVFTILSSEQDLKRAERLGSMIVDIRAGGHVSSATQSTLESNLLSLTGRLTGTTPPDSNTTTSVEDGLGGGSILPP